MATVKTDSRHYADIATKIRERTETGQTYKPSEMASGVDAACNKAHSIGHIIGHREGYHEGIETGRKESAEQTNALRDQQDAQYLKNINDKVTAYGVNGADTLADVPQSIEDVHNKGTQAGYEGGLADGYEQGHAAGITEGTQAENDRFWEAFQRGGTRTDYSWAFRYWATDYIRPKYKVQNLSKSSKVDCLFQGSKIVKLESKYFDLSNAGIMTDEKSTRMYAIFNACDELVEIEDIGIPAMNYSATWYGCTKLETIAVVRCASGKVFDDSLKPFYNCTELKNVIFTGVLDTNGLTLQYSPKLSKASIESVIGVLSGSVSGRTVTLSLAAVNKAFETVSGANDGSSSDAWAVLIQTKPSWTISLV